MAIARQGLTVVVATISMFEAVRRWNRRHAPRYVEVYLCRPLLPQRSHARQIVGRDLPFEAPAAPDLVFDVPAAPAAVLAACLGTMRIAAGRRGCDVGAGTGRLTLPLLAHGLRVVAVEPNAAMRRQGRVHTAGRGPVVWTAGVGEALPLAHASCDLVGFGSTFNVVDRALALRESARVLTPRGWRLCLWNHRRLDDPLQARIEALIRAHVPDYDYGVRREDPSAVIEHGGLFACVDRVASGFVHRVSAGDWLGAWRSHLTLRRQAGPRFDAIVTAITRLVRQDAGDHLTIPYDTRAWIAQRTPRAG